MNDPQPSYGAPLWFPLIFIIVGLLITLAGLGVIPIDPASLQGPRWLLTAFGIMFLFGGLSVLAAPQMKNKDSLVRNILQLFIVTIMLSSFSAIFLWVGFGPGERHFTGGISLGPLSTSGANDKLGRWMFGGFGLLIALVTLYSFAAQVWKIVDLIARRMEE